MRQLRRKKSPEATVELYSLARGPDLRVKRYNRCIVNGVRFHTKDRELRLRTQNSGVVVKGEHQSEEKDFYGVLTDIIELEYLYGYRVFLFKCSWWDVGNRITGIRTDKYFTSVNVSRTWYENDPFVLSIQANQVFYLSDTKLGGNWQIVQKIKPRNVYDVLEREENIIPEKDNEAYQEEQVATTDILQDGLTLELGSQQPLTEEISLVSLRRDDVQPESVEADVIRIGTEGNQVDDDFINDDETDEEDVTLMDYCTEEEKMSSVDEDTDID